MHYTQKNRLGISQSMALKDKLKLSYDVSTEIWENLAVKIQATLCIICASIILAGCSYFETGDEERINTEPPAETIDLTVTQDAPGTVVSEPGIAEPDKQVLKFRGLSSETADNISTSNVEVFSYNDVVKVEHPVAVPQDAIVTPMEAVPVEAQSFGDPSVEVFPLDEAMQGLFAIGGKPYTGGTLRSMPAAPIEPVQRVLDSFADEEGMGDEPASSGQIPSKPQAPISLLDSTVEKQELKRVYVPVGPGYSLYYDHDAIIPAPRYADILEQLASTQNSASSNTLSVEGYASKESSINDDTQRKIVNLRISMERAFAVAKRLMEEGVPYDNIRIVAWGEDHPAPAQDGRTAEEASRRVEILPVQ